MKSSYKLIEKTRDTEVVFITVIISGAPKGLYVQYLPICPEAWEKTTLKGKNGLEGKGSG